MIRVANAPCSWGVIEDVAGDRGDYRRVIDEMQQTGYIGTELGDWGFMPTDPAQLTAELGSRGLSLLASWVSVRLHDANQHEQSAADAIRTAKLLATVGGKENFIVLGNDPYADPIRTKYAGRITPDLGMSDAQWETFAKGANLIAKRVMEATGLRTVFHHHIGTLVETPAETERLMAMTDPAILGLAFDTGHWTFGGGDPVTGIRQFKDRIWHVHFKDQEPNVARQSREQDWDGLTSVGHGVFCELGKGSVDFPAVLATLREIGYDGWIVVEQDVLPGMGTPKESAARNREYLRGIGL
ncbi:MAG TPA: TIM barrel protein [Aggregatilineales bacterium]|nr:TIM barrel protein [Anaerolineae bacterium]HUN05838.1 TIM barrel protein [Aggregatilineales bacterium]